MRLLSLHTGGHSGRGVPFPQLAFVAEPGTTSRLHCCPLPALVAKIPMTVVLSSSARVPCPARRTLRSAGRTLYSRTLHVDPPLVQPFTPGCWVGPGCPLLHGTTRAPALEAGSLGLSVPGDSQGNVGDRASLSVDGRGADGGGTVAGTW